MGRILYISHNALLVEPKMREQNPLLGSYNVDNSSVLGGKRTSFDGLEAALGCVKDLIDKKRQTELRVVKGFPSGALDETRKAFRSYEKLTFADEKGNPCGLE